MRRSTQVQLVLLPMLATAAVASAQPGPADAQPGPVDDPSGELSPPGMVDPVLSPPGLAPVIVPGQDFAQVDCDDPATWPLPNQQLGEPPFQCAQPRPTFHVSGGYHVIRGGFGHYFGTGGG